MLKTKTVLVYKTTFVPLMFNRKKNIMNNRNRQKSENSASWYYVAFALVVGLVVPDDYNPITILLSKFKKTAGNATTTPKDGE